MSGENTQSQKRTLLENLITAYVLAAVFGLFFGAGTFFIDTNTRVFELKSEAVRLGHARWDVTELPSTFRKGREYKHSRTEFKWNDRKECE
jgi:hypothetical protein